MTRQRKTLTSDEADAYTLTLEKRAKVLGVELDRWILGVGKANDVRQGTGARYAIVKNAQELAARGASYGMVLGNSVTMSNGQKHQIIPKDLAGFVCANGYCTIAPPSSTTPGELDTE